MDASEISGEKEIIVSAMTLPEWNPCLKEDSKDMLYGLAEFTMHFWNRKENIMNCI